MLFNSYTFLFLFLPISVIGYALTCRSKGRPARVAGAWLVACSVVYYGWRDPSYVLLLAGSVVVSYGIGRSAHACSRPRRKRRLIAFGVVLNVVVLGVFKYADFAVANVNAIAGSQLTLPGIVLPIGISFFTFQQIAYLVDIGRGDVERYRFVDYCLFVSFFPQLIAGPIVHHGEVIPQFGSLDSGLRARSLAVGLSVFVIGLFKKVVVADYVVFDPAPVFDVAAVEGTVTFAEAWLATTAYSLRVYFDFSGYSDMAIGIACVFGIRLPINFASPYKARNVVEFWRRWHMTLSRFLREYLYIPLGGNRKGATRRHVNLMVTMLLGGLWHGAGWNFMVWGGLHGLYLILTHAWLAWRRSRPSTPLLPDPIQRAASVVFTCLAVAVAWVFFRAPDLGAAWQITRALFGLNGVDLTTTISARRLVALLCLLGAVWFLPNTQQIMARGLPKAPWEPDADAPTVASWWQWRPTAPWALGFAALSVLVLMFLSDVSEFIYYQF